MPTPRPRPGPPRWLRLPRHTARLRLTVLYGAAFLACAAAVLAVVAYLLYWHTATDLPSSQPKSSASAVLHGKVPTADVQPAGGYDIVRVPAKVPIADVRHAGRYDIISASMPAAAAALLQGPPVLTPAQQAKLLANAQFHINYDKREFLIICALLLAAIAVAAAAIGWIIAGRVLRPLSTITAAARRIAASSLHERLALHGPDDELKELADTLDNLFARLEASFDAQRRFAANASHELRTPLTRERALLQVTLADPGATTGTWQAVSRELLASNAEQERLIEALLTLASSEAGTDESEPLDLAAIASATLAAARPAISRLGLNVQTDIQPAALDGDPLLLRQLVTNLIDNAVRHNIPGGDVRVATGTSGDRAVLSVTSSGPVIPPSEVDRLFQPFQRLGLRPARRDGGYGLGLSIVRAIAAAHGATIGARARPGGGLAVDVTFSSPPPDPRTAPGNPARDPREAHRPGAAAGAGSAAAALRRDARRSASTTSMMMAGALRCARP
ncbi:MAG: HAMP domain-containing sensor histidine kinase [Streptosporangiaceae bacterium]